MDNIQQANARLMNQVMIYAKHRLKRSRIKQIVSAAVATAGAVGTGLYLQGVINSPYLAGASMGVLAIGAKVCFDAGKDVAGAKRAMQRMAEDSINHTKIVDEKYEMSIYR